MHALPFADDGFDLVWFPSFFIPERVLEAALGNILHTLRPGGTLVVGVTDTTGDALTGAVDDLMTVRSGGTPLVAQDAIARLERLGFAGEGERGMYLCHTFCELGGTPLEPVLDELRDFLVAHPSQVLVVVNQDAVTPEDFVAAVEDAGLGDLAYRGPVGGDWLTLREMIDTGQRVVFLAENRAGSEPWYRLAYESVTQETPYSFPMREQLTESAKLPASCEPNRGPDGAPLFLLNHWITTDPVPLPSNAERVNAYDPLLGRARECERLRGDLPNLVAVDFYRRGDLMRVVDTLNGVD
jgi:SAM-dependent methyltransferase